LPELLLWRLSFSDLYACTIQSHYHFRSRALFLISPRRLVVVVNYSFIVGRTQRHHCLIKPWVRIFETRYKEYTPINVVFGMAYYFCHHRCADIAYCVLCFRFLVSGFSAQWNNAGIKYFLSLIVSIVMNGFSSHSPSFQFSV